jgi:hypothetical protein
MHAERERQVTETSSPTRMEPHSHHFPCQPPDGSILAPGACECGKTYAQDEADRLLAAALRALRHAYGTPPRVATDWAVSWGSDDVNDGVGFVNLYDDEQDAREHLGQYGEGYVVRRTAISLPWVAVPQEPAADPSISITCDLPPVSPGRLPAPEEGQ